MNTKIEKEKESIQVFDRNEYRAPLKKRKTAWALILFFCAFIYRQNNKFKIRNKWLKSENFG